MTKPAGESEQRTAPADTLPFAVDMPAEVRQTVSDFIAAHYDWETATYAAVESCEKGKRETVTDQAQDAYELLIQKWCGSDVDASGMSFGSDPDHSPKREVIRDAAQSGETWVVRTRSTTLFGFEVDYEYHLRREGNRWMIKNLLYVADGEKYESL